MRLVAHILGVKERGEALARAAEETFAVVDKVVASVAEAKRPRVYLARGPEGFETGTRGSINTEIIERAGGVNVAEGWEARRAEAMRASALWECGETTVPGKGREWDSPPFASEARVEI